MQTTGNGGTTPFKDFQWKFLKKIKTVSKALIPTSYQCQCLKTPLITSPSTFLISRQVVLCSCNFISKAFLPSVGSNCSNGSGLTQEGLVSVSVHNSGRGLWENLRLDSGLLVLKVVNHCRKTVSILVFCLCSDINPCPQVKITTFYCKVWYCINLSCLHANLYYHN